PPAHFVRGSDMFFVLPSVPPRGGSTLGYYYVALTGSEFLGLSARQIPIYQAPYSNFGTHVFICAGYALFACWVGADMF
ncbi:MAG: hypothetical protein IJE88_02015, partial [Akkermansia sp.]|nr:hypothetical protein [Akkermansia sp.]